MNNSRPFIFLLIMGFVLLGCLTESYAENDNDISLSLSDGQYQDPVADKTNVPYETKSAAPSSCYPSPYRKCFDVVIVDDDCWEILLNINSEKGDLTSFGGTGKGAPGFYWSYDYDPDPDCDPIEGGMLWIYSNTGPGAHPCLYEGASAVYDKTLDVITVSAFFTPDGCVDKPPWIASSRLVYFLQFVPKIPNEEDSNQLEGVFLNTSDTNEMTSVKAWLVQGKVGPHDAGVGD